MKNEISTLGDVSQWKSHRDREQISQHYINTNITRKFLCQMINNEIIQILICHIVALIVGMNHWKEVMWLTPDSLPI